ncbi:MAG: tRNA (N6-isopentenyl adenosine(37)-C2)-methylthiotransferase MiaB [Planctomycetota bacterium]
MTERTSGNDDAVKLLIFGCQMNKLDGELIKAVLFEGGYHFIDKEDEAQVVLFVTCSVREHAEDRVHSRLGQLKAWKKKNPRRIIGVLGCMAQKDGERLIRRHPHVDLVVGTRDFPRLVDHLDDVRSGRGGIVALDREERPEVRRNEALRPHPYKAFLSVMRGCRMYCSYCVVPFVRGREESRPMDEILEEAARLLADGVIEITLLGQTVNRYDDGEGNRLPALLRAINGLDGLKRLSFITSHPAFMDDELIEAMAECAAVCRYLHLPAQSGSDAMLKKMNRRYRADDYVQTVNKLRAAMPDMEMGSDFIVGFPGEGEEDFRATRRLMEQVRFQQSFIFKYSPRPGTSAAEEFSDDVPDETKKSRNAELLGLQEKISREKNAVMEGREVEVLVEGVSHRDASRYTGRTVHNQIVVFPGSPDWVGRMVKVRVEQTTPLTLIGAEGAEVLT